MSPEVNDNSSKPYTTAADIWSVGCTLYELITLTPQGYELIAV